MDEGKPKISIIIPVYNVELYIERCCKSIFNQTYRNIEIIFVNDCTPDNSIEIIKSLISKDCHVNLNVKIINHHKNEGLAKTRNTGVDNASGDYLTFVDSDDEIPKNAIELFVKSMAISRIDPDIVMAMHSINAMKVSKNIEKISVCKNSEILEKVLTKHELSNVWGILFRVSLFKKIKWWEGLDFGEDYATLPRLINEAVTIIKSQFYSYVYHTDNQASYMRTIKKNSAEQLYKVLYKLDNYFVKTHMVPEYIMAEGKMRAKSHLLQASCDNKETFEYVCNWYNTYSLSISSLNFKEKIILMLANKKKYVILRILIKIRSVFKSIGI